MNLPTTAQLTETSSYLDLPGTSYYCYGSIGCLIVLIGTVGNIISFFYFKSKKRDISSVIYMLITANDITVSITVLPVGISALSQGQPGLIFGSKNGCEIWYPIWNLAIKLSVFLVLCLCITRTISLLRPFKRLQTRYFVYAVVIYMVIDFAFDMYLLSLDSADVVFFSWHLPLCLVDKTFKSRTSCFCYKRQHFLHSTSICSSFKLCNIRSVTQKKKRGYAAKRTSTFQKQSDSNNHPVCTTLWIVQCAISDRRHAFHIKRNHKL